MLDTIIKPPLNTVESWSSTFLARHIISVLVYFLSTSSDIFSVKGVEAKDLMFSYCCFGGFLLANEQQYSAPTSLTSSFRFPHLLAPTRGLGGAKMVRRRGPIPTFLPGISTS